MSTLRTWLQRVHGLIDGRRRERELAEELESHLQLHVDDHIRAGMTPEDARRAALLKFGAVEAIKEEYRESATISALEKMLQDLRYGARKLGRHRGFTLVTVLTLAIGVGATAAMFGLVDALMLGPPAHVREPARIVKIDEIANYARYLDIRERMHALDLAAFTQTTVGLGVGPDAIPVMAECVTPNYFAVLGTTPIRGRAFAPDEDTGGRELTANSACLEIVGVSESGRRGLLRKSQLDSEFFLPFVRSSSDQPPPQTLLIRPRGSSGPSATAIAAAIRSAAPDLPYVEIQPLTELANLEAASWRLGATIFALFGALAVALAVVGLYAALAFSVRQRTPEIGVRIAFGADPGDVARMFLRQGLVVTGVGWLIGAAATLGLSRYISSLLFDVAPADATTFIGASAIIVAAVLAGCFVPSLRASRIDPASALRAE